MKRILLIATLLIALAGLHSCSNENYNEFLAAPRAMDFPFGATTMVLKVSASDTPLVYTKSDWISIGKPEVAFTSPSDYNVSVSVTANPDNEKRKGIVSVACGRFTQDVEINQAPAQNKE